MRTALSLLWISPLLALPLGAQSPGTNGRRALSLDQIAPPSSCAYFAFAGIDACSAAAEELDLYQLWREPEVQAFLATIIQGYQHLAQQTPEPLQQQWDLIRSLLGGRLELVVGGRSGIGMKDTPLSIPIPGVVLALDVGAQRERASAVLQHLSREAASALGGLRQRTESFEGCELQIFDLTIENGPRIQIAATFLDNLLVLGLGRDLVCDCITRARRAGAESLAGDPSFQRCRSKAPAPPLVEAWLDLGAIGETILRPFLSEALLSEVERLGLADVQALYWSTAVHDGNSFDTLFIDAPAPRKGLLALSGGRSLSPRALQVLPADTVLFAAGRADLGQAWDLVFGALRNLAAAGQFPSEALEEIDRGLEQVQREVGLRLREDLLAALGEEVVIYLEWPHGRLLPNVAASIQVRDPARAEEILRGLLERAPVGLSERSHGEQTMHLVTVPGVSMPLSPSFAVAGDRLLLSLTIGGLERALGRLGAGGDEGVVGSEHFRSAFAGLPLADAAFIGYFDLKRLLTVGYDFVENMAPGMIAGARGLPLDPARVPSSRVVLRHFKSWAWVGFGDGDGIGFQGRSIGLGAFLALLGRWCAEAPGAPQFVLPRLMQMGSATRAEGSREEAAGDPQIVNPLAPGDPAEAEARRLIERLSRAIEEEPQQGQAYFGRAIQWNRLRRYDAAIADFERALELDYAPPTCAYNLCCSHSLRGEVDQALEWLEKAFELGFRSWAHIERDSDLSGIRSDPRFAALVARYRR